MYKQATRSNLFARKLQSYVSLSAEDLAALDALWGGPPRSTSAHEDVQRQGAQISSIPLIRSGWACRYKVLEDGRRQIINLLLPGDLCDFAALMLRRVDFSLLALTRIEYVAVGREELDALLAQRPRIRQALWWARLVQSSIEREWIVSIGQRSATERLAHLLCELYARLEAVGAISGNGFELPMTQIELADSLGVSAVHANRTIKELRERELVRLHSRRVEILDFAALASVAMFDPMYLHLAGEREELVAGR